MTSATYVAGHHRGKTKTVPNGDKVPYNNGGHTRLMSAYLIGVAHVHNLPLLEATARGMTIDLVRAFPLGKRGCTGHLDLVAP